MMVKKNEFIKAYRQTGSSQVINLEGDCTEMVLVHDYQKNPITDDVIHIDFLAVNANEKVSAEVSIILVGIAPVDKDGLGKIELVRDHVRVEALPADLPHHIELDISMIKTLDDGIFVRDIDLGKKVVILDDADLAVVAAVALEDETEDAVVTPVAEAVTPTT
jgi:large subunit ribosomal protein L25